MNSDIMFLFCYYKGGVVVDYTCQDIAKMIDHSLLRPDLTDEDIVKGM